MKTMSALSVAAAMLVITPLAAADSVLFSQPAGSDVLGSGASSSTNTARLADNFTLGSDATVNSVRFWGSSINGTGSAFGDIVSFTIEFFELDGMADSPGTSIGGPITVNVGEVGLVSSPFGSNGVFQYDLSLASGVALTGNVGYAFSVAATLNTQATSNSWVWQYAAAADNTAFIENSTNTWDDLTGNDFAFELYGIDATVIPLPPAAWIGLATLAVMIPLRRRASKQ